jgi:uncharacterized membrane protein
MDLGHPDGGGQPELVLDSPAAAVGPWSPIHLLSIFTLAMLPLAVWAAHRHAVDHHRRAMTGLFFGALVIAGLFTLMPGRIMHKVALGD